MKKIKIGKALMVMSALFFLGFGFYDLKMMSNRSADTISHTSWTNIEYHTIDFFQTQGGYFDGEVYKYFDFEEKNGFVQCEFINSDEMMEFNRLEDGMLFCVTENSMYYLNETTSSES